MTNKELIKKRAIEFCFVEGLQDATNRVYTRPDKSIFDDRKSKVFGLVYDFIITIENQNINNQKDFDDCFYLLCKNVCELMNDEKYDENNKDRTYFTFGKAQKLINMTFKYLAVSIFFDKDEEIRQIFKFSHCPIDSIIIERIKKLLKEDKKDSSGLDSIAWSKMSEEKYRDLQEIIREFCERDRIMPIEFDFKNWEKK